MTLSQSLIISRNWPLSFITLCALFAATPRLCAAKARTCASPKPVAAAQRFAAAKQFAKAIACLRAHLATAPRDLDAKAQVIRYRGFLQDFRGAAKELAASPLAGTVAGDELAGDLAWYQGRALASAQHYQHAALRLASAAKPFPATNPPPATSAALAHTKAKESAAITSNRAIIQAAELQHKTIRGFKAAKDEPGLRSSVAKGKALLLRLEPGPVKARLAAAISGAKSLPNLAATPRQELRARATTAATMGYQAAVVTEFVFLDRYADSGYSRSAIGQSGLRGRNLMAAGEVKLGSAPRPTWRLGLSGERRERFFSQLSEPVDTIGGISLGYDFGQPRHALRAEARWVKNPAFTYHNQFALGYSLPIAVGNVDLSLRHTRYERADAQRIGLGLSYYSGRLLWLPKAYASHIRRADGDGEWQGAVDIKGIASLGAYTAAGWLGGGSGESSQPRISTGTEQVRYVAYGASVARRFAGLQAGLSAARHSEPRFHQNTIGLNLLWRR